MTSPELSRPRGRTDEALRDERRRTDEVLDEEDTGLVRQRRVVDEARTQERIRTDQLVEQLEAEVAARERAEAGCREAVRQKSDLLAIVSHELRAPLGVVALNTALLAQNASDDERGERMRKWATTAQRAVERMTRLVTDLLDVDAITTGRLSIHARRHDALELLREVVESFDALARKKSLWLDAGTPHTPGPETPILVHCDRERLLQVFSNLLDNAIKFTPSGGSITIRVEDQPEDVHFSVADTGPGIDPAEGPRVFEPYWRGARTRSGGFGLGLSIARGIIEAHGGKLWVDSSVGHGTVFHFTVPHAQPPRPMP